MIKYIIIVFLLAFSALFSGLTLGLMSLNSAELKRKISLGNKNAAKIYPVREKGNLLLTTLLIGNVAVNSTLAIFLGSIASGVLASIIATGLIAMLGEIAPQAAFSRFALSVGAKTVWIVKILIIIIYPVAFPIAWLLNKTLGEEITNVYSKRELIKIIEEHEDMEASDVDADEERIIKGALTFSDKRVREVMTPKKFVKMLEASKKIDEDFLESLRGVSHSRLPVYKGGQDNIVGILYIDQLLGKKNLGKTVGQVANKKVFSVSESKNLDAVLNAFLQTHHHLFVVNDKKGNMTGVISLEDILEEILRTEIRDEIDKYKEQERV
ncbi:MAG: CNNM domain-containing protein [bacterium]|nr:CNNM domain-containing protein [bacterium]